jgi:hypothetical protein
MARMRKRKSTGDQGAADAAPVAVPDEEVAEVEVPPVAAEAPAPEPAPPVEAKAAPEPAPAPARRNLAGKYIADSHINWPEEGRSESHPGDVLQLDDETARKLLSFAAVVPAPEA